MCGGTSLRRIRSCTGLSPRVRGNQVLILSLDVGVGSIPACAGEPLPSPERWVPGLSPRVHLRVVGDGLDGTVYPRVCGGTIEFFAMHIIDKGLSPRVRGNLE